MTSKALRPTLLVVVALFLVATSAQAIFYTVTLKNGTSFETRYRPVVADWDPEVSMIMTDKGNWIAIANDEIADVVSVFEENGFGYQPNTTTRFIGWSPNDLVEDQVDEEGNVTENARYDLEATQGASAGGNYSIDDFLNIPVTPGYGNPTSSAAGIPLVYGDGGEDE